jgi:hypothetical protein
VFGSCGLGGLPKLQKAITRVKTLLLVEYFILLERSHEGYNFGSKPISIIDMHKKL